MSSSGASIKTLFAKIPAKVSKSDAEHDKAKEVSLKNNYSNDKRDKSHQNSNVEIKTKNNESVHVEQKESNKKKRPRSDNSEQKKKRKRIIQRDSDSDGSFILLFFLRKKYFKDYALSSSSFFVIKIYP